MGHFTIESWSVVGFQEAVQFDEKSAFWISGRRME
jgi:hypothetical protein